MERSEEGEGAAGGSGIAGWIDIEGYGGRYQINPDGVVRSKARRVEAPRSRGGAAKARTVGGQVMKEMATKTGWRYVRLSRGGVQSEHGVFKLLSMYYPRPGALSGK